MRHRTQKTYRRPIAPSHSIIQEEGNASADRSNVCSPGKHTKIEPVSIKINN